MPPAEQEGYAAEPAPPHTPAPAVEGTHGAEHVDWEALRAKAMELMQRAYAPYSNFPVGVAGIVDDGRVVAGCTTPVTHGMVVESESAELADLRKGLIEMLFVEGNHMCPSCEKSGNCQLQALAYRYRMDVPRFPFSFTKRDIDASLPHLILEHNRCIQCLRCVRGVKSRGGQDIFGFTNRGRDIRIAVDASVPDAVTEETAQKAMDICPVGALLKKGPHYQTPIGQRRYDLTPIGSDVEKGGRP